MKLNKSWFTLIEFLIASTLFFILVMMTYANYAFYGNISKVRLWLKEISQSINTARNMATNGYDKNWVNQSIWIYFDKNSKNSIKYFTFNYSSWVTFSDLNSDNLLREKKLQENVWIDYISWKNNMMIYFSSIYAKPELFYFDENWDKKAFDDPELNISISFKWNRNYPFKRDLKYFKNTNVIDY